MLDVAFVRENLDAVRANNKNRNVTADIERIVQIDDRRREIISRKQVLEQKRNESSKLVGGEKDPAKKQALIAQGKEWREQIVKMDADLDQVEADLKAILMTIPNMTHPNAPVGTLAEDNKVIKAWGEKPKFDFKPKDHLAVAEALDLIDMEAGAKVAGQKFYFLKKEAVLLELALIQYSFDTLLRHGYSPIITPDVARVDVLEGIGFMPRGEGTQIYSLANTDLCLIATAEITLGGMHRDQIMEEAKLPIKYVGLSHCFRTEAGAPGRDTRGIYRVHQFTKVEMFVYCTIEESEKLHQEILGIEEEIFQGLGLPYHVIDTCTGDLGGPAYRKYDLEAWMPGRGDAGEYGEVTSTSNCTDFQARRLNIRYKSPKFKGTRFVHTLNGTAVAVSRALVAILENYQQADGSVIVPEKLRTWMRGQERIGPRK
ncbi:MAG: serine--tRNA ligase [Gemmataceae bacterium]|nr:serine--tRNA ligase [Gemmataceae bacterium]